ncbi:transporter [Asaia sp. As-1742]|uniref:transporter n=1 Tax=Asaia sp. As-1742 TaxID=2608325 RepID=UPI00196614F2|nr:transporter [Asaia sp. As-1742]
MSTVLGEGKPKSLRCAGFSLAIALMGPACARAAEVNPGDYEQFPLKSTIAVVYYNYVNTDSLYMGDTKVSNFNVRSNLGIARLLHVFSLTKRLTIDPQFLLPFGNVTASGAAKALGSTTGVGDLILTAPLKYRLNDHHDTLSATVYLYLPTGSYDRRRSLNLGEHRVSLDFQGAYIHHFGTHWAFDLIGDVIWYGDNNRFNVSNGRMSQSESYFVQGIGRYMPNPKTTLALGISQSWGGKTLLNGIPNAAASSSTRLNLTAIRFVAPRDQLLLQAGTDVSVSNGLASNITVQCRYAHIF